MTTKEHDRDETSGVRARIDSTLLRQVFTNIIRNGSEANHLGFAYRHDRFSSAVRAMSGRSPGSFVVARVPTIDPTGEQYQEEFQRLDGAKYRHQFSGIQLIERALPD